VPWDQPFATPEPGYVLMLKTVKDRQGNVTTYNYSSDSVTFATANGSLSTKKLTSVQMPNNRVITLNWGNGTNAPTNRIKSVTDGTRTVQYGYTNGYLTSVTTPGGYTTEYGYGAPTKHSTEADDADVWRDVLTSIEDPTGGVTTIAYTLGNAPFYAGERTVHKLIEQLEHRAGVQDHPPLGHSVSRLPALQSQR